MLHLKVPTIQTKQWDLWLSGEDFILWRIITFPLITVILALCTMLWLGLQLCRTSLERIKSGVCQDGDSVNSQNLLADLSQKVNFLVRLVKNPPQYVILSGTFEGWEVPSPSYYYIYRCKTKVTAQIILRRFLLPSHGKNLQAGTNLHRTLMLFPCSNKHTQSFFTDCLTCDRRAVANLNSKYVW